MSSASPPSPPVPPVPDHPPPDTWPAAREAARRLLSPVERFLAIEASSGIVLLAVAVLALGWANSPWASSYQALWHTPLGVRVGPLSFERDLHFFINDGLMVVFFFVVGLEIRRELHAGELSEVRRAALPLFAALGGMLVPAGIFLALNLGTPAQGGWGVPMATDIAFAVGVLALLGRRVPPALRVLLLALAVIDDLGAIVVIALFYSAGLNPAGLLLVGGGLGLLLLLKKLGVRAPLIYVAPAVVIWAGAYVTGVHPTLAGVVVGLLTPVKAWPGREALSPVEHLQGVLHGWVAYAIMPLFALANAGVPVGGLRLEAQELGILAGVSLGLVLGKPLGVLALSYLAVALRLAAFPAGVRFRQMLVVGLVAGIGFTMAIFIASLAFAPGPALEAAKLGVLGASGIAGVVGLLAGRLLLSKTLPDAAARTEPEAEASTAQ